VQQVDEVVADQRRFARRGRITWLRHRRRGGCRGGLRADVAADAVGEGGTGRLRAGLDDAPAGTGHAEEPAGVRVRVRPAKAGRRPELARITGRGGVEGERAHLSGLDRLAAGEGFSPQQDPEFSINEHVNTVELPVAIVAGAGRDRPRCGSHPVGRPPRCLSGRRQLEVKAADQPARVEQVHQCGGQA